MSPTFSNFNELTNTNFNEFYNILYDIENYNNSWVDEDYAEEIAQLKWQRYRNEKKNKKYQSMLKNKEQNKLRELDLRRKLLHRIGKYELEEGEIFE